MPRKKGISTKQIKEALKASGGMLTDAAAMLDCSVPNLCQRIGKSFELDDELRRYKKSFVKFAESKLMDNIRAGNTQCIMFYLKCKGGYAERQEIVANVHLTHEDWINKLDEPG